MISNDDIKEMKEILVGWQIKDVAQYGDEGGIRLTLLNSKTQALRTVAILAGIFGIVVADQQDGKSEGPMCWSDFSQMISGITMHQCDGEIPNLIPWEDAFARQVGFQCGLCNEAWRITIANCRRSKHPWVSAMQTPTGREILSKHLQLSGLFQSEEVPDDWYAFFRGKGPIPNISEVRDNDAI